MEGIKLRKACDLCYRRKIKCNSEAPRCSNCVIYDTDCTYLAASRKKKKRCSASREAESTAVTQASSITRLEVLESRLQEALKENHELKGFQSSSLQSFSDSEVSDPRKSVAQSSRLLELPPKDLVYPLIESYLSTFNSFFPLFDGPYLLDIVNQWYQSPAKKSLTAWASVHVAMALAQYQGNQPQHPQASVADCLRKAQSVISELIMGDPELTSIQIVLGLVMLFIGTPDARPSAVLIATAIKLVHSMGLHRREGYLGLSPPEALQRKRVFWIAYILDRDISLRTRQPPVQHDMEIDVDLPSMTSSPDEAGFIKVSWTNETFNFFRSRVRLAQIQGEVYDCLYSVNAQRLGVEGAIIRAFQLRKSIQEWQSMIPLDFSAEVLSHDSSTVLPQYFCQLYAAYVSCLGQLCRATSMDLPWIDALLSHTRKLTLGDLCEAPRLPEGWDHLVNSSRSVMTLFMSVQHKESAFVWTNICTYASGLVCLSANSVLQIQSSCPDLDQLLVDNALRFINQLSLKTNHEGLRRIGLACAELNGRNLS